MRPLIAAALAGVVAGALVSACGQTSPGSSSSATPSPSPSQGPPAHTVIVVLDSDGVTVEFVRDDGTVLGTHKFSNGLSTYAASAVAAGRFWYVAAADHHLHSIAPDGTDVDVAALSDTDGGNVVNGLAVSSDGQRWAWGILVVGASGPARARIDVGGAGATTRMGLEEPSTNTVLIPVAWTPRGLLVSRSLTGIGGCCYLTPETGGRDAMLVDPATLHVSNTWTGCATALATASGSFACVTGSGQTGVTVHPATGPDVDVSPLPPVAHVGWALVDDTQGRVLFAVIHSFGAGGGDGPYKIDTEQAALTAHQATHLLDQVVPDAALPDGRIVVTEAPAVPTSGAPGSAPPSVVIATSGGGKLRIGAAGAGYLGAFQLIG
jgi:hypothetical protein